MPTDKPFTLSPEQQSLALSALNAYLYELRHRSGRANVFGKLILQVEDFRDELFQHHYGATSGEEDDE